MKNIIIPFKRMFWLKMADGVKTATSRTKKYGEAGDRFLCNNCEYELTSVHSTDLGYIADTLWQEEGCDSKEHFIEVWNDIHPIKKYAPSTMVYLHRFVRIK